MSLVVAKKAISTKIKKRKGDLLVNKLFSERLWHDFLHFAAV